jgi:oligoribonuclease
MSNDELMPWVDIETFGLDARVDPIIEVGIKVTTSDLQTVAENSWLIWSSFHDRALERLHQMNSTGHDSARIVLAMHNHSGLFIEAKENGKLKSTVAVEIQDWLIENQFIDLPMCGSSIQFDRNFLAAQMSFVESKFHYRNIDVSTIKELCRRYRPDLYDVRPDLPQPHRALPDLENSIKEFDFYRKEFLNA